MDFDSIIVFLVIIYFVWRTLAEAKSKMGDQENNPPKAQPQLGVDFLNSILGAKEDVEFELEDRQTIPRSKSQKTEADYLSKGLAKSERKKQAQQKNRQSKTEMEPEASPTSFFNEQVDRKRLREAVIWSEILGRPLALRDDQESRPYR